MKPRVFFPVLVLGLAAASSRTLAAGGKAEALLAGMRRDVARIEAARDALRSRAGDPASGGEDARNIDLQLREFLPVYNRFGLVGYADLIIPLRTGGRLFALPATAVGKGAEAVLHRVDASGLRIEGDAISGSVRVFLVDEKRREPVIAIDVRVEGAAVSGTYRVEGGGDVNGRQGAIEGAVQRPFCEFRVPAAPAATDPATPEDVYRLAQWHEAAASTVLREVRALAASVTYAVPLARAADAQWDPAGQHPHLEAGAVATGSAQGSPAAASPSVDDLLQDSVGDLGLPDFGGAPKPKAVAPAVQQPAPPPADDPALLGYLQTIADRVALRAERAEAAAKSPLKPPAEQVADRDPGDELFGPWYGATGLKEAGDRVGAVPADAGTDGPQAWPWVSGWVCVGPFPRVADSGMDVPLLPEFVPGRELKYRISKALMRSKEETAYADPMALTDAAQHPANGYVTLPVGDIDSRAVTFQPCSFYAVAEVDSAVDADLWLGVTADDGAFLWVNHELVWRSPADKSPWLRERTHLTRARFRKGRNTLVVRCDNNADTTFFGVRICTRGRPQAGRKAETAAQPAGAVGWRYDGSGRYPDATPPLAWDGDKGLNVRWRKPMPYGHATPVIVGDGVLVTEDPQTLVCLNKATGEEMWRTECDIVRVRDAAVQAEAAEVKARVAKAREKLDALGADRAARVASIAATGVDDAEAQARVKELERQTGEYWGFLERRAGCKGVGWGSDVGQAYATPLTDRRHIWVKFNTGALACLDMKGTLVWLVDHGCACAHSGATASPVYVDGRILVFGSAAPDVLASTPGLNQAETKDGVNVLRAFDAATGKTLWTARTYGTGMVCGTPVPVRLKAGAASEDVVMTANGTVVRVSDGNVLLPYVGVREQYGSPIADAAGTVVLASHNTKAAFRLVMADRDTIGARLLWHRDHPGVFQDGNYGLMLDGRLYYSRPELDVTDLASGDLLWTSGNVFFTQPGRGYEPVALAGGRLYVADNATWFQPTYRPSLCAFPGAMSVVDPGVPGLVLARNRIEQTHGGFAFDGDRLYVRSKHSLMCYGHTGDEGLAYEAATVAAEVMDDAFPQAPAPGEALIVSSGAGGGDTKLRAASPAGGVPDAWLCLGTVPEASAEAVAAEIGRGDWGGFAADGPAALTVAGQSLSLRELNGGNMNTWAVDGPFGVLSRERFSRGPHIGWRPLLTDRIDVARVAQPGSGQVAIFATVLTLDQPKAFRVDASVPQAKVWIGGRSVAHNQCVALPAGRVPMVIAVRPATAGEPPVELAPKLWPSHGYEQDLAAWTAHVSRCRPYLESAAARCPDTPVGRQATAALAAAKR